MLVNGYEINPLANLLGANLLGANLRGANLRDANLRGANLRDANLPAYQIPQEGELIVWKSLEGGIAKGRVPAQAKRTASIVGRKCRAEYMEVLEVYDGEGDKVDELPGLFDRDIIYRPGDTIHPDSYDPDIRVQCTNGIHFFLTKEEAEEW